RLKLYWIVAQEKNVTAYEIQKSTDGLNFSFIGKVNTYGIHTLSKNYDFVDEKFFNKSYYRLKMIDADGKYLFSNILTANPVVSITKITIFPNPAKDFVNINIGSKIRDIAHVYIRNISGSSIITKPYILSRGNNSFLINVQSLPTGIYSITVTTTDKQLNQSLLKF
ncbi:MAG TPA: T9SS type A sorting domain-containing protein, partial [Segetibacter sp.]